MLPAGKLDPQKLKKYLNIYSNSGEEVLLGPMIGEDAAAIGIGGEVVLSVATDPIIFATDQIGYYSVMVNANDVAATGAEPKWFSVTILLPELEGNEELAERIFIQISRACKELGVTVIGGHTEIARGLNRPIVIGQMIGIAVGGSIIRTGGAKPGDTILLSKGVCVEGTSLIAREKEKDLTRKIVSNELIERAKNFLFDPGISVVEEALLAIKTARIHSMHDITEGGLANGLHEIAVASCVEMEVELAKIPVYEETKILCDVFDLYAFGLIGSGSLLITAGEGEAEKIIARADKEGMKICEIGRVNASEVPSAVLIKPEGRERIPYLNRDEIVKIL